jgi:hypothetical protein
MYMIFVFDFDKTITKHHTSGRVMKSHLTKENILNNISNISLFRTLIPQLIKNGHRVLIATYADDKWHNPPNVIGGRWLVNEYMNVLFGVDRDFLHMKDFRCYMPDQAWAVGKNLHLVSIIEQYKGSKKSDLVLFDDSHNNYAMARKVGYGAVHVKSHRDIANYFGII